MCGVVYELDDDGYWVVDITQLRARTAEAHGQQPIPRAPAVSSHSWSTSAS